MKSFVFVILFVAPVIVCGGRLIVGGDEIDIAEAPHLVVVINFGIPFCGGSLISRNFVLSAAHCLGAYYNVKIRAGSKDKEAGGLVVDVEEIFIHPKYMNTNDYDFALLRLSDVKEFPEVVQFISLPDENDELKTGEVMQTAGWGATQSMYESDRFLRGAFVPIYDLNECKKLYYYTITDQMVCAGFKEGGINACFGDSGGSLMRVLDKVLIGITSFKATYECLDEYPVVYAKVSAVRDWIREKASV